MFPTRTIPDWLTQTLLCAFAILLVFELALSFGHFDSGVEVWHFDKLLHFCMHMGNVLLAALAFPVTRAYTRVLIALLLLGPAIESVQFFLPYRSASILDQLANLAGVASGYLLAQRMRNFFNYQ